MMRSFLRQPGAARKGGLIARAAAVVLGAAVLSSAEPTWTRVKSEHFIVSGDAGAEGVRSTAFLLEMFREVFLRVLPGARDRSLIPPFVVVFGSDREFTPYKPRYQGKAAPVGGYVVQDPLAPCVALRLDGSLESTRTTFHEYAHVLFGTDAPLWLREGISDYYSTVRLDRDRRRAVLGTLISGHVARAARSWVPIAKVIAASQSSNIWDGEAGQAFYAESWVLVHYLTLGTDGRGAQIAEFLDRIKQGADETSAFERAIGPPDRLDGKLKRYVRSGMAQAVEIRLPEQVSLKAVREHSMSAAEVEATLGRLLFQLGRDQEALSRLNAAIRLEPELAEAHAVIGRLQLKAGNAAEAVGPFRRANASEPDNFLVAYDYALVSLQAHDAGLDAPLEEARQALSRVVTRDGGRPEPTAVLGTIAGRLGRIEEAEGLLRQAAVMAPQGFATQLELANVCLRVGKFDEAREILARLAPRAPSDRIDAVTQRQRWLAMAEERAALRAELAAAAGVHATAHDPALRNTGIFPKPLALRTPLAGEHRTAGLLESIACSAPGVVAHVITTSGPLRLSASGFSDVYVASARHDAGGIIGCGARENREAVYVTWTDGRQLVAIEFLPEEYQPRR